MSTLTEAAPIEAGINRNQLFWLSCLSLLHAVGKHRLNNRVATASNRSLLVMGLVLGHGGAL